ncbi:MAG: helical backbone metal receptor, partial [Deferrisomatales bacterium]|nr:helical backbone metal receptor [Deferrisomatales bacterium]
LQAAFADAFRRHGGPVAAVGSDCPLLGPREVEALWGCLGRRTARQAGPPPTDAALIPATDGGYAAIALAAPLPEAFEGIPWSTPGVLAATLDRLRGAGRAVGVLAPLPDVDRVEDLAPLAEALTADPGRAPATAATLARLGIGASSGVRERLPQRLGDRVLPDALGRPVPLGPIPRRILSLVPSVTECLFDLGAGARVVGRTAYCISPAEEVGRLPSVGGPKTVDPTAAAALAPDLVLANAEENDRGQVEALAALGLRVHVAFPRTLGDAARFLEDLGVLLGEEGRAHGCAARLREAAARVPGPPVRAACLVWKDPYLTASSDTLTAALLAASGAENAVGGLPGRYPEISGGDLAGCRPRVVLLPSEPYPFGGADAREVEQAVPGATALLCPGEWLTWYGCRIPEALAGLRRLLDPFRGSAAP